MGRFSPPGFVDDFARRPAKRDALAGGWDAVVQDLFTAYAGLEGGSFYDPRSDDTPGEPDRASVPWDAFPRALEKWFEDADDPDAARWRAAETLRPRLFGGQPLRRVAEGTLAEPVTVLYRQQDEYCEWFVQRDDEGRITRVTFTCESPEYWRFLAAGTSDFFAADDERAHLVDGDIELVAELYREHVDPSVAVEDLLWPHDVAAFDERSGKWFLYGKAGAYNPFNRWTTTHGSMHLTHPANTLEGEFRVAARAAVLRKDGQGNPVDDAEALVCCSGFGEPNRSSDPSIGAAVNGLARDGLSVSLAEPVGLYIAGITIDAFRGPGGESVPAAWTAERGTADQQMVLRASFAAPAGSSFGVEDMRAGGTPISYGGQIADEIQMILTGLAKRRGTRKQRRKVCVTKCCEHPEVAGIEAVVAQEADCSTVDWQGRAPVSGIEDEAAGGGVHPEAAFAGPVEMGPRPPTTWGPQLGPR